MCTKKTNLKNAVEHALKDCPALLSEIIISTEAISVDITGCYDDKGNTINQDCLENCKSGSFNAFVKITTSNVSSPEYVSGSFKVTDYDPKTYSFTVVIQIYH